MIGKLAEFHIRSSFLMVNSNDNNHLDTRFDGIYYSKRILF